MRQYYKLAANANRTELTIPVDFQQVIANMNS